MDAKLIRHDKVIDELENTIEIKMWQLPEPTKDKPHGYKYSLVYVIIFSKILNDIREVRYESKEDQNRD